MSKGMMLWFWIGGTFLWAGHAMANEATEIVNATGSAKEPRQKLITARHNLLQMRPSLAASERDAVDFIMSSQEGFDGILSEAETVGVIFKDIACKPDQTFVGAIFEEVARRVVLRTDLALKDINVAMPLLTNPNALAEATKMRDLVAKFREIYSTWSPKGKD